ncbi:putative phosphoenolpyruvate synthase [Trichonephila inaurata madagascariensis]|uniref:Putative phosphoenolpyruvate synthase n=1 Tax=Trichonephila inaurata madagascariensis TaxID=2747483 RepID=A0A8X7BX42_9ARAC|nr:putative phosphoenolpyruvate synthase [Trichonephila inaurata madagascariensis]
MCVIQEKVACEVSGVLFTLDPVTSNPSVITITANYAWERLSCRIRRDRILLMLRRKDNGKLEFDSVLVRLSIKKNYSGGTVTENLDENSRNESCISRETALRLGKLSINIEKYYKTSCDIEWGILNEEIYILQSRPVTTAAAETDSEIRHEFDAPLQCENEYFTVANVGEVLPGATSTLGIDLVTKYFSNILKRQSAEKGLVDNLFKSKYFLTGFFPFSNHLMITVEGMMNRYGFDTPRSKGFMISIFGRILDDPDLLEYARNFLNYKTAEETFEAILKSCSDFDDAGRMHIDCSESSSNWNMHMFTILCQAKGNFDTDVYSDFALLLATSSNVESANVPQAMQEVANQIVKDVGSEKFSSLTVEFDLRSITWGMNPKLLVKLLQNLVSATKEEIKKGDDSMDKIFSQLRVPLSFMSKCLLNFSLNAQSFFGERKQKKFIFFIFLH